MAKIYNVNFSIGASGGDEAIYELKNVLTGSGGTVSSSSNGTTFNDTDLITSPTAIAGANRFVIVREPGGGLAREWSFQRGANERTWTVKISPLMGFKNGGSTTVTPTATDEEIILNNALLFQGASGYKIHVTALNTPYGPAGNEVYPFWFFTSTNGSIAFSSPRTLICQEPLATGSYPPLVGTRLQTIDGDADPAVYACRYQEGYSTEGQPFESYTRHSLESNMTFRYFHSYSSGIDRGLTFADDVICGNNYPLGLNTMPSSRQDPMFPIYLGRTIGVSGWESSLARTTQIGFKGATAYIRRPGIARSNSDTTNLSTDARIYLNSLLVPWPEGVTPSF